MAEQTDSDDQNKSPSATPAAIPATATINVNDLREALREKPPERPTGPNATTAPKRPAEHYFVSPDGRQINAFGEEKGSKEDRQRMAAIGFVEV